MVPLGLPLLSIWFACVENRPLDLLPIDALADKTASLIVSTDAADLRGTGPHTWNWQLTFDQMTCQGIEDDVEVRFQGELPAHADLGADTWIRRGQRLDCTRDGQPSNTPTFSSPILDRVLGEPFSISVVGSTHEIRLEVPGFPVPPRVIGIEAVGPMAAHFADVVDPDGTPVVYAEGAYQLLTDRPWLAGDTWIDVDDPNYAGQRLVRTYPGSDVHDELPLAFDGTAVAVGPARIVLEAFHELDWRCNTQDLPDCITTEGVGTISMRALDVVFDLEPQLELRWGTMGDRGEICHPDGSCNGVEPVCHERFCTMPRDL